MANVVNSYEFMLVASVKLGEKTDEIISKFEDLIRSNAELVNVSNWGKRKLAYLINKESEGAYVIFEFKSTADFPKELDRVSGITDGVLRTLIIKKDEPKKRPMGMRKRAI